MRILVMNPNTTVSMTASIRATATAAAAPGTEIVATEPLWGPESIEGHFEGYLSAAAVLDRLATLDMSFDALVMAGFGEPGREGAQELLDVPVLDITESAAQMAMMLGHAYGIVTTLDRAVPQIQDRLLTAGLLQRCAAVRGTGLGVLELEQDAERTVEVIIETAREVVAGRRRGHLSGLRRHGRAPGEGLRGTRGAGGGRRGRRGEVRGGGRRPRADHQYGTQLRAAPSEGHRLLAAERASSLRGALRAPHVTPNFSAQTSGI